MMTPGAQQIGEVAVGAVLHRLGVALSVDVAILLIEAAGSGAAGNTQQRQLAAAKRGLEVMQADATRLERRVAQLQAEVAQWQARAERALRAGDVPLARQALSRKLQLQRIVEQYADQHTAQQQSLNLVRVAVAKLEVQLRDVSAVRAPGWVARCGPVDIRAARDQATVEARFAQFELDQAMDALRRTVQR